jgi:hypothetical protein
VPMCRGESPSTGRAASATYEPQTLQEQHGRVVWMIEELVSIVSSCYEGESEGIDLVPGFA